MKLSGFFVIFISFFLCGSQLFASTTIFDESSRDYNRNRFNFEANYRYFKADANYTQAGGEYVSLPSGYKYQVSDFDFGIRWTTGLTWGFYTSARASSAESTTAGVNRSNSEISQVVAGVDMLMISNSAFDFIPDLSLTFPLQRVSKTSDKVLTSEGALELSARGIARLKLGRFVPFASAGITYRDEGRSTLLPYNVGAEIKLSSLTVGGDVGGYQTILKDQYTNNSSERHSVVVKNGSSLKYYSVDPSLLETSAWVRWSNGTWGLRAGAATTITGANAAAGLTFFGGLHFSLDGDGRPKRSKPIIDSPISTDDEVQKFEETTNDGVDQNLFRKPVPPPKQKPRPDPAQQRLKMQQELDQTEFQIELKKTPKKKRKK